MVVLFQIEEPDGSVAPSDLPGLSIGIDLSGTEARLAASVGGNAEILRDREGNQSWPAPMLRLADGSVDAEAAAACLLELRGTAERALGRPVTHAALVTMLPIDQSIRIAWATAALSVGLTLVEVLDATAAIALSSAADPAPDDCRAALGAALRAEAATPRDR